jgi:hypothetical protein
MKGCVFTSSPWANLDRREGSPCGDQEHLSQGPGVAGVCKLRYGTLETISRKQHFIVPAQTQWTYVQRLSPENKGVSPYVPLQAGYGSKKQGLIHIWLYLIFLATLS